MRLLQKILRIYLIYMKQYHGSTPSGGTMRMKVGLWRVRVLMDLLLAHQNKIPMQYRLKQQMPAPEHQ
jgi:hypothetical protein